MGTNELGLLNDGLLNDGAKKQDLNTFKKIYLTHKRKTWDKGDPHWIELTFPSHLPEYSGRPKNNSRYLHQIREHPSSDSDGPQEFVDVVRLIPGNPAVQYKYIVHVQALQDWVGVFLPNKKASQKPVFQHSKQKGQESHDCHQYHLKYPATCKALPKLYRIHLKIYGIVLSLMKDAFCELSS